MILPNAESQLKGHSKENKPIKNKQKSKGCDRSGETCPREDNVWENEETGVSSWRTFPSVRRHFCIYFLFLHNAKSTTTFWGRLVVWELRATRVSSPFALRCKTESNSTFDKLKSVPETTGSTSFVGLFH